MGPAEDCKVLLHVDVDGPILLLEALANFGCGDHLDACQDKGRPGFRRSDNRIGLWPTRG